MTLDEAMAALASAHEQHAKAEQEIADLKHDMGVQNGQLAVAHATIAEIERALAPGQIFCEGGPFPIAGVRFTNIQNAQALQIALSKVKYGLA